jgi:hypothetical protein
VIRSSDVYPACGPVHEREALPSDTFGTLLRDKDPKEDPSAGAGKPRGSTRLVLARHRLASEADNLEVGDVGHLRTVGGLEEGP